MFNIKSLAIALCGVMPVRDAMGEPQFDDAGNAISITFHSPASKQYQKAKHASELRANNRLMARMQGNPDDKQSAADKIAENAEFLAACTISFNGIELPDLNGHELFKAVYSDMELGHIAENANKFLSDRANFMKAPAKPLPSMSGTQPG